jgi:GAF domain-containing protein
VDLSSGFRTRSILCIPVRDTSGKVVGALQVINKQKDDDDDDDGSSSRRDRRDGRDGRDGGERKSSSSSFSSSLARAGGEDMDDDAGSNGTPAHAVFTKEDEDILSTLCTHVALVLSQRDETHTFKAALHDWEEKGAALETR